MSSAEYAVFCFEIRAISLFYTYWSVAMLVLIGPGTIKTLTAIQMSSTVYGWGSQVVHQTDSRQRVSCEIQ